MLNRVDSKVNPMIMTLQVFNKQVIVFDVHASPPRRGDLIPIWDSTEPCGEPMTTGSVWLQIAYAHQSDVDLTR